MVVLPDYQGIGIGTAFEEYTSQHYADNGWNVNVTTTTPALTHALMKSEKWSLVRYGRSKSTMADFAKYGTGDRDANRKVSESLTKTQSNKRITYSFNFIK